MKAATNLLLLLLCALSSSATASDHHQQVNSTAFFLFDPQVDDPNWPGLIPSTKDTAQSLILNIQYDAYPFEIDWSFEQLVLNMTGRIGSNDTNTNSTTTSVRWQWELIDESLGLLDAPNETLSLQSNVIQKELAPGSHYRLFILDHGGDGLCCDYGLGWATLTTKDGVLWSVPGDLINNQTMVVHLLVDKNLSHITALQIHGNK